MTKLDKLRLYIDPDKWKIGRQKMFYANYIAAHAAVVWWCLTSFTWAGFALGFLGYLIFGKVGGDIGLHRYFSHQSFKTSKFKEWLLLILGTLAGFGSSISWTSMHGIHHSQVDTMKDPHSPERVGLWRTYFYLYDYRYVLTSDAKSDFVRKAVRDRKQLFIHRNYFKLYYAWLACLGGFSYAIGELWPIMSFWAWTVVWTFHGAGSVNALCHRFGYQNYTGPKAGKSTNLTWLNFLLLGGALHNNHHGEPWNYRFDTTDKWYEFDLVGKVIKYVFMDKEQRAALS